MPPERIDAASVSYGPGECTALAAAGVWIVADARPGDAVVTGLWQRLAAAGGATCAGEVADRFVAGALGRGFALAYAAGNGLCIGVAGDGSVTVRLQDRVDRLTCPETAVVATYRLGELPDTLIGEIGTGAQGSLLPLSAGVVPAGQLLVAWEPEPAAEPEPEPDETGSDDRVEDGVALTMSRSSLDALAAEASGASGAEPDGDAVLPGPTVHAVRCPEKHLNPAHVDVCRVCGAAVEDQMPVAVPRPVLGELRFSTGDIVSLDRGVLIGREPSQARSQGDEGLHVVRISSPDRDISRDHLEVRLVDWQVLVTDLRSTNGTTVTRPEWEEEPLRPNQATQIEPGTVVTLADVVTFTFAVTG